MPAEPALADAVASRDSPAVIFPDQRERQWRSRSRRSGRSGVPVSSDIELPSELQLSVWTGTSSPLTTGVTLATGIAALDAELPGRGWPHQALTEVLTAQPSVLEWRLLAPALRSVAAQGKSVVLIAPPKTPYLPGLQQEGLDEDHVVWINAQAPAQRLWCTEQILKAQNCGALVSWLPNARPDHMRRLQICAGRFDAPAFVFRGIHARHEPSAAPLRLIISLAQDWELEAKVFKRRGPAHDQDVGFAAVPRALQPIMTPRLRRPSLLSRSSLRVAPGAAHAMGSAARSASRLDVATG